MRLGQVCDAALGKAPQFSLPFFFFFFFLRTHFVLFTAAPTERKRMILAAFPI